jgi:hypothetical protein
MNLLEKLNNDSFITLNDTIIENIRLSALFFTPIGKDECINFLLDKFNTILDKSSNKFGDQDLVLLTLLMANKHILIPKHQRTRERLIVCVYLIYQAYYHSNDVIIISPTSVIGNNLIQIVTMMADILMSRNNLFNDYKEKFRHKNIKSIGVGGRTITSVVNPGEIRGYTTDIVYISDAAFLINGPEMFDVASNSLRSGGQMIMSSTYNGRDDLFYNLLTDKDTVDKFTIFPMVDPKLPQGDPDNWPFKY